MAINERLIHTAADAAAAGSGNQEEGLILYLDANDVDSFDGQGDATVWYDITNHEYKPATNVSEHFNTVTYTGTGASNPITGVGFQPDLIWVKRRNSAANHYIVDTVRGNGTSTYKNLSSNTTDEEGTTTASGITNSTIVDGGFTMQGTGARTNADNSTYVAWCLKAGGAALSNTDGDTTSQVSANQDLGFSIVKHTGTASNTSIGHGLGIAPELIITKNTTDVSNWSVSGSVGGLVYGTNKLQLNTTAAIANDSNEVLSANGTTFTVGSSGATNGSGDSNIHYCFASKRGVSKVGSYTGTDAAGNKVYTGFEPAFVMIKNTSDIGSWIMIDNKRATSDPRTPHLRANTNGTDDTGSSEYVDFDRDGFTVDGTGQNVNDNGDTYIYIAFAKDNNETTLIPDTDLELHLDAASYSGSGTTWTADTGNNATVVASRYDEELGNSFDISTDGESTIQIASGHPINGTFTLEFWFKFQSTPVAGNRFIYDLGETKVSFFYYQGSNYGWRFYQASGQESGYYGNGSIEVGKWQHKVITLTSSGSFKAYIDGELIKSTSWTRPSTSLGAFDFGTTDIVADKPKCDIGQIRMYSAALTADQVRQNYLATRFDYPNGFNGAISGATWNSSGYFNFDGNNDYVDTSLLYKENNTVSMWVNFTSNSAIPLWGAGQNSTNWIYCAIVDDQDSAHNDYTVNLWIRAGSSAYNYQNFNNVTLNSYGNWNFLTFRMEELTGANFYMSVNGGAEQQSVSYLTSGTVTSTPNDGINIGRAYTNGTWSYGNSKISKFKVHDKPLTQAEITALNSEGE